MATIAKNFTVHKDLAKALEGLSPYESREKLFHMELQRLDAMYAAFFSSAVEGDIPAADMCLKIQSQRMRLCGLMDRAGGSEININLGDSKGNAEDTGIAVTFVTPSGKVLNELGAEVVPFNRPAPLRLVEHVPEPMPDPPPPSTPSRNFVSDPTDYSVDNLPAAREHTPPTHPEVVRDQSKRMPDPKGPRTEMELKDGFTPGERLFRPKPDPAA